MIQILASNGPSGNGIILLIFAGLAIAGIIICIKIGIIIAVIKYVAKEIGKSVSNNFDYDYLAEKIAYEIKKGSTKVYPRRVTTPTNSEEDYDQ